MSEKRFTVDDDGIYDNQEKKHFKFIAYDWMECDIYECCEKLNEQQDTIEKQEGIIKSQDAEISRQYKLCLAMSGILREEFGVYDVFDRSKDKRVKDES